MRSKKNQSWKGERASVHRPTRSRPKSNKFSKSDSTKRPMAGSRHKVWVGGHTRTDGTKVRGHFRSMTTT